MGIANTEATSLRNRERISLAGAWGAGVLAGSGRGCGQGTDPEGWVFSAQLGSHWRVLSRGVAESDLWLEAPLGRKDCWGKDKNESKETSRETPVLVGRGVVVGWGPGKGTAQCGDVDGFGLYFGGIAWLLIDGYGVTTQDYGVSN